MCLLLYLLLTYVTYDANTYTIHSHSHTTNNILILAKLRAAQMNCQLDSSKAFPSHSEMVFELPRQIPWNSYFEVPIYTG